jgi:hypothetical protein
MEADKRKEDQKDLTDFFVAKYQRLTGSELWITENYPQAFLKEFRNVSRTHEGSRLTISGHQTLSAHNRFGKIA